MRLATLYFLIAGTTLALIHLLATELYLYWQVAWFDLPVHLLGGIVAGLGLFVLSELRVLRATYLPVLWHTLAFVLTIALLWEGFEVAIGIPVVGGYWPDTLSDLAMGLLGGSVAHLLGRSSRMGGL